MSNVLKKVWYFAKQKYGPILLSILLIVICFLSIRWGQYLLSNDNYSPELNPAMSVSRYLESPAWRGYRVLGIPSDSEQADIFRSVLFQILQLFIPKWFLAQFYSLICLVIGTLSIATLSSFFIRDFVNTKKSGYVFFVSGLLYISSLWTGWVFNFNMMPYISQYGFLPLLLLSIYLLMKDFRYSRLFFLFIASLLFVSVSVIGTLFFVNVVILIGAFSYFGYLHRVKLRGILKSIGLFLTIQLFWLLPFIFYTNSTSQDIIDSYTNRSITANTIDLEKQMMDLPNSARLYTRLLGTIDTPEPKQYIFPLSEEYMEYDFYKIVGLLPIFFSVIGLLFVIFRKEYKLLPIWIALFAFLFILKNQNPPLGGVYIWLQENFSIFKQVFRWVSSKLGQQYLIFLTITSSIGFLLLLNFLSSFFKKIPKYLFMLFSLALISLPLLLYSEYLFRGDLFTKRATVDLPNEYFQLAEELKEDPYSRIYYAPPSNNGYFREYDWGFVGSQFISYVIPNPVMDLSLAIGSDVGEKAMQEFRNTYDSGNTIHFTELLSKYNVDYILVDKSLVKGRYGHEIDWEVLVDYTKDLNLVWQKNFLELYRVKPNDTKFVETLGESDSVRNGSFIREIQKEPVLSLLNFDISDLKINGNSLTKNISYSGNPTTLYLTNTDYEISKAPISIKKNGGVIKISPALPSLDGIKNESFKEIKVNDNAQFFVFGSYVVDRKTIEEGINFDLPYEKIDTIGVVSSSGLIKENLTEILADSLPGDCSGGGYEIAPEIEREVISSGFTIESFSELPCVYTNLRLDKRLSYVGSVSFNWESDLNSVFGYCINSEKYGGCINKEKYFSKSGGFGQKTITIPKLIEAGDKITLTLYAQNPFGKKVKVTVRDVSINYAPYLESSWVSREYEDKEIKVINIDEKGQQIELEIPILYGDSSYVYSERFAKDSLWRISVAEDSDLVFKAEYDLGMKQNVQGQMINQFDTVLSTIPNKEYLWYWQGENRKNIPSNLCLTYQGSDRCWVDNTFFASKDVSEAQIFSSSGIFGQKLDASYNSISFSNESENILKNFVLMEIPEAWQYNSYSPALSTHYSEVELSPVGKHASGYKLEEKELLGRNTLVSIPQAKSKYWIGIGMEEGKVRLLTLKDSVSLNGWKQGWDTNGIVFTSLFVIYWPNLLSYLGYLLIFIIFVFFVVKLIKSNRYAI